LNAALYQRWSILPHGGFYRVGEEELSWIYCKTVVGSLESHIQEFEKRIREGFMLNICDDKTCIYLTLLSLATNADLFGLVYFFC
jgi:hypothetical protein